MKRILIIGDELLRQKAEPAAYPDKGPSSSRWDAGYWDEIVREMLDILKAGKGVGLAGPQIGLMQRIFVTHIDGDISRVFINPSIIETSQETVKYEEGCLSIPGVWANIIRPKEVKVQAWNEKGRPFTIETGGILARVILHEHDHLEGILFIDRLPEVKKKRILDKIARRIPASRQAEA